MAAPAYIPSPCIGICTLEDEICVGCLRSAHDILNWSRWSDAERTEALAVREHALKTSFNALFILEDEALLWNTWEDQVGWFQRPETHYEAWFQVLEAASWKQLPKHCGISGRFSLGTTSREKILHTWLDQLQSLRAQGLPSVT